MELYKKYRPKSFKSVLGNKDTVKSLQNMLERETVPHTIMFQGPSGCGKTTFARILKSELNCHDMDFVEMNCSDFRGIDTIRDIAREMRFSPTMGNCRIWLLDEVHQMSKDAQNAALKVLEDTPEHVYFILCTTDPQKIINTIKTRCCTFTLNHLTSGDMMRLIRGVSKREKIVLGESTPESIIEASNGSPRQALVILDKISTLPPEEQEDAISVQTESAEVIDLCRSLVKKEGWAKVSKHLRDIKQDPESVRWAVLGYAKAVLMKSDNYQAYHIMTCFEEPFYDSKEAGLVRACYEAVNGE